MSLLRGSWASVSDTARKGEGMGTKLKEQPPEPDHTDPQQVEKDLNADLVTIHEQGEGSHGR